MPTNTGYRLYVESTAPEIGLAPVEQLIIRHQFGQVSLASEQWFRLAAAILAGATRNAGLATPAKPRACRVRRIDLVINTSRMASLVLVLAEGAVKSSLIPLDTRSRSPSSMPSHSASTPSSPASAHARSPPASSRCVPRPRCRRC